MKKIPTTLTEDHVHQVGGYDGNRGSRTDINAPNPNPAKAIVVARATDAGPDDKRLDAAAQGSEYKLRSMPKG